MTLNLQSQQTKILYLPLKDEKLPNLQPHTTLTQSEHSKLNDIKSEVYDVCTGITKERYSKSFLSEVYRTLKPGGIFMFQIGKEVEIKKDLTLCGFTNIESKAKDQINHVECRSVEERKDSSLIHSSLSVDSSETEIGKTGETFSASIFIAFNITKTEIGKTPKRIYLQNGADRDIIPNHQDIDWSLFHSD